ncbi:MAG TPA: hypothetical protein VFC44_07310 [Candidatus Saccharimonadales bacterium]|nr:hypothetical protein [Candidatus Saccharimonadales bacterium]
MKVESVLTELWAVKDKLAGEADYNVDRFVENLRQWEKEHPQTGRVIRDAEELRQFVAEEESKREAT